MTILDGKQFSPNTSLPQHQHQECGGIATERLASPKHQGSRVRLSKDYTRVATDEGATPPFKFARQKTGLFTILKDCASIVFPMAYVAFVIMLWLLDETEVIDNNLEERWLNAITVAPYLATIFPIMFASVVGRLVSESARWRLERGATVGSLEQLIGSRTVGGTFVTLFSFPSFNILAVILFSTWACSPLGTQALLRMESASLQHQLATTTITYFDDSAKSYLAEMELEDLITYISSSLFYDSYIGSLASRYTALIMPPDTIKADSMDLWGNVKIPFLHHSEPVWKDLPVNSSAIQYSSLAGIPLGDLRAGNTTFMIESSYLQLQCGDVGIGLYGEAPPEFVRYIDPDPLKKSTLRNGSTVFHMTNGTWHGHDFTDLKGGERTPWILAVDRFVDPFWLLNNNTAQPDPLTKSFKDDHAAERERPCLFINETGIKVGQTNLLFQANVQWTISKAPTANMISSTCRVTQKYVESRVNCRRVSADIMPTCRVTAQRLSQKQHAPEDITPLSFPKVFNPVSKYMPRTVGGQMTFRTEYSLCYLQDPSRKGMRSQETQILKDLTAADLQVRLAQLLNTYLMLGQLSFQVFPGGPDSAISQSNQTVAGETRTSRKVFKISDIWAFLCLLSGTVMLGAGLMGVLFKHWARGPEILGHVSTVLRESKYMDFPPDAAWAEGLDLSRDIKGVRIRYGVTILTTDGKPLVGVRRQEETEPLNHHL
ncbi:hypothetical protein LZ30DRAFT_668132 [Colletotrichum cereale]|nr:hypothetical protein LZ30DRAFT_668132 [Colletotrichum cereale]